LYVFRADVRPPSLLFLPPPHPPRPPLFPYTTLFRSLSRSSAAPAPASSSREPKPHSTPSGRTLLRSAPTTSCRRSPTITVSSGSDRKSTRLNSSHVKISYAVFCLKKKNTIILVADNA